MKKTTRKRRENSSPSSTKNLASFIFSFLLSLTLVVIAVVFVAGRSLSKNYILSRFDDDYIRMLSESIYNSAVDYTLPTGVDVSVLDGVFTEDAIKADVRSYFSNSYDNNKFEVDTSSIEASLTENVKNFLLQQGINPSDEIKAVEEYVKDISKIYKDRIKLTGLDYISRISKLFKKYSVMLIIGTVVFALVNAFLCIKLHSYLHRGLRYVVYSFGGAAIMTFAAPFAAYLNGFYKNLQISPNYFNHFIVGYFDNVLSQLFLWAGIWFVVMVVLIVVVARLRSRIARRSSKSRH